MYIDLSLAVKVSVIARGGMGGYNLIGDTKNGYHTEGKLREDIAVLMGGRAAEEVVLGEVSPVTKPCM